MIKKLFRNVFVLWSFVSVFVVLIIILVVVYLTQNSETQSQAVVSVNGETVSRAEVDTELERLKQFYSSHNQNTQLSRLEEDTIEKLVERKLLTQYAASENITVSDAELQKRYEDVLKLKAEEELLTELKSLYGIGKEEYFDVLYLDILREKVQKKVGKPYAVWIEEVKNNATIVK